MARRKGDFIVGVLGRLEFKVVNGIHVISPCAPKGTIKQTEETRKACKVFRMASLLAGKLKAALKESFFAIVDSPIKNILIGIIVQIFKNRKVLWARHERHGLHENFPLYTE